MSATSPLVSGFLAALEEPERERFAAWRDLGKSLRAAVADARGQFAQIAVDDESLARYVGERTDTEGDPPALPVCVSDLLLACGCANSDPTALRLFESVLSQSDPILRRLGLSADDRDDVKQELRERLLVGSDGRAPKIQSYLGAGPLVQWVRAVAGRQALQKLRRARPSQELDEDVIDVSQDPALAHLKQQHSEAFKTAFHAAIGTLDARDRGILRALVIDDRTVSDVANLYRVHRVTASRWVSKIRNTLLRRTRDHLRAHLSLSTGELDSLFRMIESQIELSLYRVLDEHAGETTPAS